MKEIELVNEDKSLYKIPFNKWAEIEIGDKTKNYFSPHAKIKKWGEECFIKFSFPTTKKITPILAENKLKWIDTEKEIHFYPLEPREFVESGEMVKQLEQGGFESEVIEKIKPASNVITLDLELGNVKASYQKPFTERFQSGWSKEFQKEIVVSETTIKDLEGNILASMAENAVGSYVFYRTIRQNMWPDEEKASKYKICKIGTLYRSKVVDAVGKWAWTKLKIENGKLKITRPQEFLDNAVYPIKKAVGLDFGYKETGDSSEVRSDTMLGYKAQSAAGNNEAVSFTIYAREDDPGGQIRGVLVPFSDFEIVANGVSSPVDLDAGVAWKTTTFPTRPLLVASTWYVLFTLGTTIQTRVYFDVVDPAGDDSLGWLDTSNDFDTPTDPTDAAHWVWEDRYISVYCIYEAVILPAGFSHGQVIG